MEISNVRHSFDCAIFFCDKKRTGSYRGRVGESEEFAKKSQRGPRSTVRSYCAICICVVMPCRII